MTGPVQILRTPDRAALSAYLRSDADLHLYEIGDLDPMQWPRTQWWALADDTGWRAVALLYAAASMPTLLALGRDTAPLETILRAIDHQLPSRLYMHLSEGLLSALPGHAHARHCGRHLKMSLRDPERLTGVDVGGTEPVDPAWGPALVEFYARAYPGHWFDPSTLNVGPYRCIREGERIVCVAGLHVCSTSERVAAIGNIATDPEHRGRGLARRVTAALCRDLMPHADVIGLNVHHENLAAIRCYTRLGFVEVAHYDEYICDGDVASSSA